MILKKIVLILSLFAVTTVIANAPTTSDRTSMEQALKAFFENYGNGLSGFPVVSKLSSVSVDESTHSVVITATERFSEQEFTPEVVRNIYNRIRNILPPNYRDYNVRLYTHGMLIEDLVPNRLREHPDRNRTWGGIDYKGKAWVTNASRPNNITRGLEGRHLTIAASHGKYYDAQKGQWKWQRPNLFCTTEDLFTQTIVIPYLIPMLENAGAIVWSPRERDWQRNEVIVDNDGNADGSVYREMPSASEWQTTQAPGFSMHPGRYHQGENPFNAGTARMTPSTTSKQVSQVVYQPQIPEEGRYAVYVSYQTVANSVDDACYTVWHKGRRTEFRVNQRMGGDTWVYLGTFDFAKGCNSQNMVVLSNASKSHGVVTTDAVRFGGGMGNIERGGSTSGVPRCLEGTRYSAQWMGAPDSVYNYWGQQYRTTDDYKDDLNARSRFSNWLAGGSVFVPNIRGKNVPIELMLSVHSDAGYDKAGGNDFVGTLSICTTDHNNGRLDAGISRMASHDLADALLANAGEDIKAQYGTWRRRVLYDRNYNETREPAVPSAILEVLSHQNFGDMRYGLDPNFRFTLARSIYKTLLRYVNEMHGTKYVVQPLPPRNFKAELSSHGKAHLSWNPVKDPVEPSATPSEYILYTAIGDLDFDNGVVVKGTSCTVNIAPNQLYHFRVVAANNGGCSFPTEVLSVEYVPQSEKTVLIVNGFHRLSSPAIIDTGNQKGFDLEADAGITYGRMAGWAGRQTVFDNSRRGREGEGALGYCGRELEGKFIAGNEFNYVREHATAIHTAHKYNIVSCSSEAFETGKVKLGGIDCIDLVLGLEKDDGHSLLLYKAFSQDMQKRLRSFVRDHGSLLVSGSFVGSDMRTESEQRFLADVLKLHLNGSQQGNKDGRVQGLGMTFDTWRTLNETHYAATSPDVLSPTSLASCVMKYSDGQSAAVAYSGRDYRCLTVGFPLECITDRRSRDAIMRGILNYLVK